MFCSAIAVRGSASSLASACAIGVVLIFARSAPASAAEAPEPGLWQTTSKSERAGVVRIRPTRTRCISPEQSRDFAARTTRDFNTSLASCQSVDLHKTENGMTWRLACTGALPVGGFATYAFDSPQHYVATIQSGVQFFGMSVRSTLTIEGRRIGECPK